MSLPILLALIMLASAAEDTSSVTSLPISRCEESYVRDQYFDMSDSILSLGRINLTVLIIWEGQTQLSFPQLYFFDFESRSFSRKSLTLKDRSESVFGQVLSRGNERIYVPWADGDSSDISRSFFESHLLSSVKNLRVIVMFDPEFPGQEMSSDSELSLMRLFSLLNGTYEVHLVLAEDPGYTTIKFYNFTHHSAYLKDILNSCKNCAEHYVRRWILHINQVSKNFPAIPYGDVFVKSAREIFSEEGIVVGSKEERELVRATCSLLQKFSDAIWEPDDYIQFDFAGWPGVHNLTEQVILTLKNDSLQFKTYNQTPVLKRVSSFPETRYKQIRPEKNEFGGDVFLDIKHVMELYPKDANYVSDLLHGKDEEYYEYKLDGSLQGVYLLHKEKENKTLLTGIHNMEDLDEEEYIIQDADVKCFGDLMVITGVNVTLNVKTKDCPFRMLIVRASAKIELTRSLRMPGINLFIYSPLVKSVGSHVINLSGENCLEDRSGGDGGNFTLYMDQYEGKPLKVISNGGKGCNGPASVEGLDPTETTRGEDKNLTRGSNLAGRKNGKKGKIVVFSTDPDHDIVGEISGADSITWKKLTQRFEYVNNDFIAHLSEREKIQIFIGHVMNDNSQDGRRAVDQVHVLRNYTRSSGHNPGVHRMYDPFGEPISDNALSALKWLAMQNDSPDLDPVQIFGSRSSSGECYRLTIDSYEIECAIDLTDRKVSSLSYEVAEKLRRSSVGVINCSEVNLRFVSEFHLVVCKVGTHDNSHITYPFAVDEGLTCYGTWGETIACHCKRNDSDFDEVTALAKDFALAVLTVRHVQYNPLQMIRAPLTGFTPGGDRLDMLTEIFRGTYMSLVRDLEIFYEEVVKPKAEMAFTKTKRILFDRSRSSFALPGVVDSLGWSVFIQTELLGCAPERFHLPKMLAELAQSSSNNGSLEHLRDLKERTVTARMTAIALYLRIVKSQLGREGLPAQLKRSVSAILEKFTRKIKDAVVADEGGREYNLNLGEVNLTFVSNLTSDFRESFNRLEAGLPEKVLRAYRRTIGKYVNKQDEMLDVIQSIVAVAEDKKELETALPHAIHVAEETKKTFRAFDVYSELIRAFENAISEPDPYLNELYAKILQKLNSERNYLIYLRVSNSEIADLKPALETAFDLELEVYRALQTVRRMEDVRGAYRKIGKSSEGFGSNARAIRHMHNALEDSISSFVFDTVRNDFDYRIFPFHENVTLPSHEKDLERSIRELEAKEKKYGRYFKRASFDPGTCKNSCRPFYSWSDRDIQRQGQDIRSLFQGRSLFLLADLKNGYPGTVKARNFRIRFLPNGQEESFRGMGVLLRPASFTYISFRNEVYLTTVEDKFFEQVLGETIPDPANNERSLMSPYTLWKVQLTNVSGDLDKASKSVKGIELVGEGEVVADATDGTGYVNTPEPEEWECEDVYLTLP